MNTIYYTITLLWIFVLTGCNLAQTTPVSVVQPTVPYIRIAQSVTITPTEIREIHNIVTNTPLPPPPTPEPTVSPYTCGVTAEGEHIQHEVVANVDYATKRIDVAQSITYRNETDVALNEMVLNVEPNTWDGAFSLHTIMLNGTDAYRSLDDNRLTAFLPTPMNPGCAVTLNLQFTLQVPRIAIGASAYKGYFGYGERQTNLGLWLPTVAPRHDNEWVLHEPQTIGEQVVLEQADWDVTLNISNSSVPVQVAAPGIATELGENQWHYIFESARDFPVSLSQSYRLREATTREGIQVALYHYPDTERFLDAGGTADGAPHALDMAVKAVEQFTRLFGRPPFERLLVVQGDFPDGMEFSGLVFVSTNWFYGFEGGVENYLTVITVHEIAHQWWYALVGNDSASDPWLDEALTTYSEYIFYEEYYPELKNWWWSFRVAWYNPQGAVDSNVYDFTTGRDYINAIYLRGVQMLHNLREDIGTQAFFDLLAAYAQAGSGEIATPEIFWSLLTPAQWEATQATREEFLSQPELELISDD